MLKLTSTLEKLITFKTLSKNFEENKKALDWIKNQIKNLPVFIKEFNFNNHLSLVITTKNTKTPLIFLAAHLDVVDGSRNVFIPKIKNKKIFGRGAFDMKFAIACYLELLKDFKDNLKNYDFGIMITTDEEIGGFNGTKFLLDKGFKSKVCILPDGGEDFNFEIGAKGVFHILIESYGKSVHGSRPWLGENAIDKIFEFYKILKNYFPKEPCRIENHFHNTLNLGKIEGGKVTNQVPDFASAYLDIRFTPEFNKKKILNILNKAKKNLRGIKIKELIFGNSYKVDTNNVYFQQFVRLVREKLKIKPVFIYSHGSSDARFFNAKGIPIISTRPKGGGHHSENEWIDIRSLENFYLILKEFLKIAK